jgi:putative flippase GtrA
MRGVLTRGLAIWRDSQRLRFIMIGAYNTAFGYATFAVLFLIAGNHINYLLILVAAHFLSVGNAFLGHRHVTFRSSSHWPAEFVRFNVSYLGTLAFSLVALRILVGGLKYNPLVAAAVVTVSTVLLSYTLHQRFSFRRIGGGITDSRNDRGDDS